MALTPAQLAKTKTLIQEKVDEVTCVDYLFTSAAVRSAALKALVQARRDELAAGQASLPAKRAAEDSRLSAEIAEWDAILLEL